MSNVPPTEKEKLLMRMMAKLYSKNTIEEELTECINQNGRSPLVDKAAKIFKIAFAGEYEDITMKEYRLD